MVFKGKKYTSIELLQDELSKLGYTFEQFTAKDVKYVRFVSPNNKTWLTRANDIDYPMVNATADYIINNKNVLYELTKQWGISTPDTLEISKGRIVGDKLVGMLKSYQKVIVKPLKASLARGLTLNISSLDKLVDAIKGAHKFSDTALIQQQVYGEEVRFTILDGKVVSAILRRTPRVTGDGKLTVRQLIAIENESRQTIKTPYESYPQLDESIIDPQHLESDEVLKKGKVLELGKGTMIKSGASVYDIISEVHPSYMQVVERIAAKLGAGFFVTDLFIQNYKTPLTNDNYSFIECNTGPILKSYYSCRDGKSFDVLKYLIPLLDTAISGTPKHK